MRYAMFVLMLIGLLMGASVSAQSDEMPEPSGLISSVIGVCSPLSSRPSSRRFSSTLIRPPITAQSKAAASHYPGQVLGCSKAM